MKRIKFLSTCYLVVCLLTACGTNVSTKEISVTGSDGTVYNSYQTACSNGDFDAARDYIGKMKEKLIEVKAEKSPQAAGALEEAITEAETYIENEEVQYLASLNNEQANNRVILIMNQRHVEGLEAAEKYCLGREIPESTLRQDLDEPFYSNEADVISFRRYIKWCGEHNSKCSHLLSIAIACGNQSLAKKILLCFRSDPELMLKLLNRKNRWGEIQYDIYAHYTNASKDAAQKKYDEAIESGAFN